MDTVYEKKILLTQKQIKNQLHVVSRTQQGRQRDPSVKRLCSTLSIEFSRIYSLSGGTQRCVLPGHQSEELKI